MTVESHTSAITELLLNNSTYDWNSSVSSTSPGFPTSGTTTEGQYGGVPPVVPAVIVFSVIILILAIVIFGVKSKRRQRRPTRREKREEDETLVTEAVCKESIYLDVLPSTAIEADDQVERETPYVTLEFESKKENADIQLESVRPIDSVAENPGLLLESQETKL